MPSLASSPPSTVSVYDARPFFEKALQFGVQAGILDSLKLEAICTEAPKGMVQIARYFGNENLRPDLEKARERIVNLVSLHLESSCKGDLRRAAELLREHSLLSRSKAGSDMLKALIVMPQNSHFGMGEGGSFSDDQIALLAKWSLRSLADYQAEFAKRSQVAEVIDAAVWLADQLGLDASELEEAGKDAEAVIRTAILQVAIGRTEMPDWMAFEKTIAVLRKAYLADQVPVKTGAKAGAKVSGKAKPAKLDALLPLATLENLPERLLPVVQLVRASVLADLPKIFDSALPARQLFDQTPAFIGRYFWVEDALSEVAGFDQAISKAWDKATGGHSDEGSLLTLLLCVAAGAAPKTLLSEKAAGSLIRKIQKTGLDPQRSHDFILAHAPAQYQDDYARLWTDFMDEAQQTLQSDVAFAVDDALALLRRECRVK
jgi:hypothetical protein